MLLREYHEFSNIFPLLEGEPYESLKADIAAQGLQEPIWLHPDGRILDGRNRYRACLDLGIAPAERTYAGPDPLGFVISLNLHRRHLDESQRSLVAAKIANMPLGGADYRSANLPTDGISQAEAAELLNVSERSLRSAKTVIEQGTLDLVALVESGEVAVSTAAEVATLPAEEQREVITKGEREILAKAKEIRQKKAAKRRKQRVDKINRISNGNQPLALPRSYPVLYADVPWRYEHAESESRVIENHYPTMTLDQIRSLPVGDVSAQDAILFFWATSPKLAEAMSVLEAWGYTYRTCIVWDKERIGMGYYARQQHELLLIATRGEIPTPLPENRPPSVIRIRRGEEHSEKPTQFHELIERMYPEFERLELFARSRRDGWEAWGNQS